MPSLAGEVSSCHISDETSVDLELTYKEGLYTSATATAPVEMQTASALCHPSPSSCVPDCLLKLLRQAKVGQG